MNSLPPASGSTNGEGEAFVLPEQKGRIIPAKKPISSIQLQPIQIPSIVQHKHFPLLNGGRNATVEEQTSTNLGGFPHLVDEYEDNLPLVTTRQEPQHEPFLGAISASPNQRLTGFNNSNSSLNQLIKESNITAATPCFRANTGSNQAMIHEQQQHMNTPSIRHNPSALARVPFSAKHQLLQYGNQTSLSGSLDPSRAAGWAGLTGKALDSGTEPTQEPVYLKPHNDLESADSSETSYSTRPPNWLNIPENTHVNPSSTPSDNQAPNVNKAQSFTQGRNSQAQKSRSQPGSSAYGQSGFSASSEASDYTQTEARSGFANGGKARSSSDEQNFQFLHDVTSNTKECSREYFSTSEAFQHFPYGKIPDSARMQVPVQLQALENQAYRAIPENPFLPDLNSAEVEQPFVKRLSTEPIFTSEDLMKNDPKFRRLFHRQEEILKSSSDLSFGRLPIWISQFIEFLFQFIEFLLELHYKRDTWDAERNEEARKQNEQTKFLLVAIGKMAEKFGVSKNVVNNFTHNIIHMIDNSIKTGNRSNVVGHGASADGSNLNTGDHVAQNAGYPDTTELEKLGVEELLKELKNAIKVDELSAKDKEYALEKVEELEKIHQNPETPDKEGVGKRAMNFFLKVLPATAKLTEAISKLLPPIAKLMGIPIP